MTLLAGLGGSPSLPASWLSEQEAQGTTTVRTVKVEHELIKRDVERPLGCVLWVRRTFPLGFLLPGNG